MIAMQVRRRHDDLAYYRRSLGGVQILSKEEATELKKQMQAGGAEAEDARRQLVESVLPLAWKVARSFVRANAELPDLIQEANIAAVRAVDNWDPDRGCLSTVVSVYIQRELITFLWQKCHRGIRVPQWILSRVRKAERDGVIDAESNQATGGSECARHAIASGYIVRLSELDRDGRYDIRDNRSEDTETNQENWLQAHAIVEAVCSMQIPGIAPKDVELIRKRFGLGCEKKTLEEIGKEMGVCKERVRQKVVKVLEKLKKGIGGGGE